MKKLFKFAVTISAISAVYLMFAPPGNCGKVYIPKGTEISISFKTDISTAINQIPAGTDLFEIAADQTISGVKVIQRGGRVFGVITKFKKPGLLGGGGEIEVRIDSVNTTLGRNIAIKPKILGASGSNKKLKAILMLPLLGYGLLVKGDHAELGKRDTGETVITSELKSISY